MNRNAIVNLKILAHIIQSSVFSKEEIGGNFTKCLTYLQY